MGKVSRVMADSFLNSGGEISLNTKVDQILMKDGRPIGVLTEEGRVFEAPLVISNVNPNLLTKMLPPEFQKPLLKKAERFEYSLSSFILYVATDLNLNGMGLPYFTYLRSLSDLEEEYRMMRRGEIPKNPTLIVSIPTLLDPSLAPNGRHILKILVVTPYQYREEWGKQSPGKRQQIKEEFCQKILIQLESKLIPDLRNHLLFYEAAAPLTLERYTGNELGAMYGLASTPEQIGHLRPSHQTPIPGLFQVGHYTRPSHGIVGVSLSGLFAARAILKQMA
jgi:prolycopene isomerase